MLNRKLLILLLTLNISCVADDFNIDQLLTDIKVKTDLSEKTKLANNGISTIYTRDDIDRMQVRSLKDILKLIYPYNYTENRFGISDPLAFPSMQPFNSSIFRVFIDNQEITTSLYGSGLFILGDIDIDFIDHVEIYTQGTSYEFSSEPTFFMIRLYSKKASKDAGSKIKLDTTNYGGSKVVLYNSDELDNFSYFTYLSHNIDKRKKYDSHGTDLSRDKDVTHLFTSLYDDKQNLIFELVKQKKDAFINYSPDATPTASDMDINSIHIGYDTKRNNFTFNINYDYLETKSHFLDDTKWIHDNINQNIHYQIDTKSISDVISLELKYDYITPKNKLIVGAKYRYKAFEYKKLIIDDTNLPRSGNTNQRVANIFLENQYSLKDNSILTFGIQGSSIRNNSSIQQDDLLMYRVGHTYTNENFTVKTVGVHMETTLDPFLVNSYNFYITEGKKGPQKADSISQNIIYQKNANKYEIVYGLMKIKNYLSPEPSSGLLENQTKILKMKGVNFKWTYEYNQYDKLYFNAGYNLIENIVNIDNLKKYTLAVRNINTYKKFDIFNEVFYYKDNYISKNNSFNYSAGVKYHHTKNLTFSIKGENLLDKAKGMKYPRLNLTTFKPDKSLYISPIDRTIIISMEYLF